MILDALQFGVSGQLGRALLARRSPALRITGLRRAEAELNDPAACAARVEASQPQLVIIAAAYTQVDQAEQEPDLAMRVNADAPAAIAEAAARIGAPVIYLSTDYVFDGAGGAPYAESSPVKPLGQYGLSKLEGERRVAAAQPASLVLRTSWVFDAVGENFLTSMLRLGAERDQMRIVDDQQGGPTPADALAEAVRRAAVALARSPDDQDLRGVFHFQGAPHASWADFAEAIFAAAAPIWGRRPTIERISTAEYPTPALRPLDTRLDCSRFEARFGVAPPQWRAAVVRDVAERLRQSREPTS